MTYTESIEWLYSTQQFGIKLGLEQPIRLLRETESFPSSEVKIIHVAGTNGKGSTCAIIDSLARSCGTRSGLFTSPHLIDYRERIQVDGVDIPAEICAQYLTEIKSLVSHWDHHPTFFEITLAVAMLYFRETHCELIILETGMGGRLDATTAVPADIAVITPIAMDHAQHLGNTLHQIAREKAGIIMPNKPVLSSYQMPEARLVIEQEARDRRSPLQFITTPLEHHSMTLSGIHQRENAALALAVTKAAGINPPPNSVRQALSSLTWPGRFETIGELPIILDGAHNVHAAKALVETWLHEYPERKASLIFGAAADKCITEVLKVLAPIAHHIHLTPINTPRSLSPQELVTYLPSDSPTHSLHDHLHHALTVAKTSPSPILITGSLFLIGEVTALLAEKSTPIVSHQ